uniref:Fibronectin type-III domain-containing protein n=1 Tax=Hippocampus comes TaxID=109280 RepID=A0A3Q2YUU0_HIPCM
VYSCSSGMVTVTWDLVFGANLYRATAVDGTGASLNCTSASDSCQVTMLKCEELQILLGSVIQTFFTSLSLLSFLSVPCPPTPVIAVETCGPGPVPVSWVASDSANSYTAIAVSSAGYTSACTTNETSCNFYNLMCGQVYNITVAGVDNNCTGLYGDAVPLYTGNTLTPCIPTNVSSQLDCAASISHVFWNSDPNAASYTVTATNTEQMRTCVSTTPNCTLTNLLCDQTYDISVTATDGICVSSESASIWQTRFNLIFKPSNFFIFLVPCAPGDVNTTFSCNTNDLMVSWRNSSWPLNYSIAATPLSGNLTSATCYTDSTDCSLSGLHCGQAYNVSVRGCFGDCPGPDIFICPAPCAPQNLEAMTDCSTHSIWASWNASSGATSYTATMTGPNGFFETCSTSNLMCSFSNLQCATQYSVNVTAHDDYCTSPSARITMTTGPCDPLNVTAVLQCGSDAATVSWHASAGAASYHVLAYASHTTVMFTSGTDMHKGYKCNTNYHHKTTLYHFKSLFQHYPLKYNHVVLKSAEPCQPASIEAIMDCETKSAMVSWLPGLGAASYVADLTASSGHTTTCTTNETHCLLGSLPCGEQYNVSVASVGDTCDSTERMSGYLTTGTV